MSAIAKKDVRQLAPTESPASEVSIATILDKAVQSGMSTESLEKIVTLYERMADRQAEAAFAVAMSQFKSICPPVTKRTENNQFSVTVRGTKQSRRYASLQDIEQTIRAPLGECGLSFRWGDADVSNGVLKLTCIVSHIGGHSKASSVVLPVDSKAGCSDQQKYGIAMTYAQRYSLIQALGLTSCDEDQDGNDPEPEQFITEQQAADLDCLIASVGAKKDLFLGFMGVTKLSEIPASRHAHAVKALESKRKAGAA